MKVDVVALQKLADEGYLTVRSHPTAHLIIWNYTARCQYEHYWTPETLMCRGLITTPDGTLVARPFPKFFNYEEHQDALPLEPFKVTEKMDGSLGILYFVDSEPFISTRGSFASEQAIRATQMLQEKFGALRYLFMRKYTYLFEIIYPSNRIVVDYGTMEDLVLLAIIDTETGKEFDIHALALQQAWPELSIVKHYDGIADVTSLRAIPEANQEGFVICFESGLRLKMKYAEYVRLHRLITQVNARVIWDLLRNKQPFDELLSRVPDEFYQWVATTRDTLLAQFTAIEEDSRQLYEEVKQLPTRKEQAIAVAQSYHRAVIFRMLDGKDYAEIIWKQLRPQAEKPFREDSER